MSYLSNYQEAQKKGEVKKENIDLIQLTEENPLLVGKYIGFEERESTEYGGTFLSHTFETDDGPVSIAPGTIADKVLSQKDMIGRVFAITFLGKGEGKGGRHFNNYRIESFKVAPK